MKKMIYITAMIAGISTAMYYYFKKNPEKFESLRHQMMDFAYGREDDMMM